MKRGKQLISVWNEWEPEDDMNLCPEFKKVVGGKHMLMAVDWIVRDFGVPKAERKRHLVFLRPTRCSVTLGEYGFRNTFSLLLLLAWEYPFKPVGSCAGY